MSKYGESDYLSQEDLSDDELDYSDDISSESPEVEKNKRKKGKVSKGKKRVKRDIKSASYFLELAASENDDDEEDEDQEELSERQKRQLEAQRMRMQEQFARKTKEPGFLKIYDEGGDVEGYLNHAEEEVEDNEMAILPTAADPKLFAVKCKPNQEREVCFQIMKKYWDCFDTKAEFEIFSCTAVDKASGYIYIEAHSDKHVYLAVANIPNVFGSKVRLVDFTDRTQIFETDSTKDVQVKIGQWVRIKKGLYEGDLAQVEDVDEMKGKVEVRLVPRFALEEDYEENKGDIDSRSKRRVAKNKLKPPQRLFKEAEHDGWEYLRNAERGVSFILYKKNKYCDGLLYKKFALKNLVTENVTASYEESKCFTIGETADCNVLSMLIEQAGTKAVRFFKGDRVKIVKGDMMNLEAEVIKINPLSLTVRALNFEYGDAIEIMPSDCVKFFKTGEYVRVVNGSNAGKEGFVMSIEENIASLMADGLKNAIQVFVNDLIFCNESTRNIEIKPHTKREMEQEYVRFDLVKLNDKKTVGIVLGTSSNGWKILDNFGNTRTVSHYQIEQKLNTRNSITKNDKAQTFRVNNSVRILQGKYQGQNGVIKHIYNDVIFIYNPDVVQNMGVIIEKANNCFLLSAQTQSARSQEKDILLGQKCTIKSGQWKGYQGIVKSGNEKIVRLELSCNSKMIDVQRELVISLSEVNKSKQLTNGSMALELGSKTPMMNRAPQSPDFGVDIQSPAWGFESPAYDVHFK